MKRSAHQELRGRSFTQVKEEMLEWRSLHYQLSRKSAEESKVEVLFAMAGGYLYFNEMPICPKHSRVEVAYKVTKDRSTEVIKVPQN